MLLLVSKATNDQWFQWSRQQEPVEHGLRGVTCTAIVGAGRVTRPIGWLDRWLALLLSTQTATTEKRTRPDITAYGDVDSY